jgi:hypothetical protein
MNKGKHMKSEKLFARLDRVIEKVIQIPNGLLPTEYHNQKGYVSLSTVKNIVEIKEKTESQHKALKREKATRIKIYREQLERTETLNYIVDEYKLYNNQVAFCSAAVNAGWIDLED